MKTSVRNVYVFNGYGDRGGAFLNYQIGRICNKKFGSPVFIVRNFKQKRKPGKVHSRFNYEIEFPEIPLEKMKKMIKPNDLFICNPAHSTKWFGLNLPCKKLMYIQGMNTYPVLDIFFDHYVSVSQFVQEHVKKIYTINPPVISPFINHSIFKNITPWKERRDELLVLGYKGYAGPALSYLKNYYKENYPSSSLSFKMVDGLTQKELADLFNQYKYFLTLNPSEGFGLPPLEAMACGCAVVGFDSMGGRDYLVHEKNSFIVDYGRFDQLADYLQKIELDPNIGEELAKQAVQTASKFNFKNFEAQWFEYLRENVYN